MDLLDVLQRHMNKHGISQRKMAQLTNIDRAMLCKLLNRKRKLHDNHIGKISLYLAKVGGANAPS